MSDTAAMPMTDDTPDPMGDSGFEGLEGLSEIDDIVAHLDAQPIDDDEDDEGGEGNDATDALKEEPATTEDAEEDKDGSPSAEEDAEREAKIEKLSALDRLLQAGDKPTEPEEEEPKAEERLTEAEWRAKIEAEQQKAAVAAPKKDDKPTDTAPAPEPIEFTKDEMEAITDAIGGPEGKAFAEKFGRAMERLNSSGSGEGETVTQLRTALEAQTKRNDEIEQAVMQMLVQNREAKIREHIDPVFDELADQYEGLGKRGENFNEEHAAERLRLVDRMDTIALAIRKEAEAKGEAPEINIRDIAEAVVRTRFKQTDTKSLRAKIREEERAKLLKEQRRAKDPGAKAETRGDPEIEDEFDAAVESILNA